MRKEKSENTIQQIIEIVFQSTEVLDKIKNDDIENWQINRNKYQKIINNLLIKSEVKKSNNFFSDLCKRDFYINIYNYAINFRYEYYFKNEKIFEKYKTLFILKVYLYIIIKQLITLISEFKKISYSYKISISNNNKSHILALNLPKHAFNYKIKFNNERSNTYYSFAEYFIDKYGLDTELISIYEYTRPSFENELIYDFKSKNNDYKKNINILSRRKLNHKKTLSKIISRIIIIFKNLKYYYKLLNVKKSEILIFIPYIISEIIKSIIFEDTLIQNKILLSRIYFTYGGEKKIGLSRYKSEIHEIMCLYSYSENFCTFPNYPYYKGYNFDFKISDIIEKYSPMILNLSSRSVGYDLGSSLNSIIFSKGLNNDFKINQNTKKYHTLLGFENIIKLCNNKKNILIFDVPPENYFQNYLTGDLIIKEKFIINFLKDIIEVGNHHKCNLYLKPKYSLTNYQKFTNYVKFIENALKYNLEVLEPYSRISPFEGKIDLVLCYPYTTMQKFYNSMNIPSFYYISDGLIKNYHDNNFIIGKNSLNACIEVIGNE